MRINLDKVVTCHERLKHLKYMISYWSRDSLGGSDLVGQGVTIRIRKFLVQTPQGTRPGLGTQHHYKAPDDLGVEIVKTK